MLNKPTVFVIGAGAGVEIGMPVGNELAGQIAEDTNFRFDAGKQEGGDQRVWTASLSMARAAGIDETSTLTAGRSIAMGITYAQSIDNYVHTHSDKEVIKIVAKNAIVHRILEAERNSSLFIAPSARGRFNEEERVRHSWLQAFFSTLQDGVVEAVNLEDIFDKLSIINFNYDRCIEHFLFQALQRLYPSKGSKYLADLVNQNLTIIHPYGVVGQLEWQGTSRSIQFGAEDDSYDLTKVSGGIRTYNEEVEDRNKVSALRDLVSAAERIVFLGFHFHKQNIELISPEQDGPRLSGSVDMFATQVDRSLADKRFILERRLWRVAHGRFVHERSSVMDDCDCAQLFKRFAILLAG